MDYDEAQAKIQEWIRDAEIKVTDETTPTQLFDVMVKLMARILANQPTTEQLSRELGRQAHMLY